ncbi:site-specific integrase [Vibrio nigripulchritudo]|uniref:site-specific integrase n=1 Tax=Vibrio nigripulchritudo TaxID=28173 RepID=UPI001E5AE653|nr:site-specific integrase [Vibrio nigripulchritudo]
MNYRIKIISKSKLHKKISHQFIEKEISKDQSYKICNHLGRFLEWINEYKGLEFVNLSTHTALPDFVINEYINDYLINTCGKSEAVAKQAVDSLNSYYDWLAFFLGNNQKFIGIQTKYRKIARSNNASELTIKYLLPQTRELLYRNSSTLLQEIVLRNGGELGCRSRENQGFLLEDQKVNQKVYKGILTLFKELEIKPYKEEFEYRLSSLYTKYGRARNLFIPRSLLEKMKLYFDTERPHSASNHLLVSSSKNYSFGQCVSKRYGSDVFAKVRRRVIRESRNAPKLYRNQQVISESNTYHHLRHSFGTDFFYNLCEGQNKDYESITTSSSVYLMTANRLGHKVDSKYSNTVTASYIHSCGHREDLLKEVVNGAFGKNE